MVPDQSEETDKAPAVNQQADADLAARQAWMAVLARSNAKELSEVLNHMADRPGHQVIRGPEIGLVMARGRAGGQGQPFNLGEVTVTRATVRLETGEVGQAYVRGRSKDHAELAALSDALLQRDDMRHVLDRDLLQPIQARLNKVRVDRQSKVAATKVDFFTMVRGED